jgi:transposase
MALEQVRDFPILSGFRRRSAGLTGCAKPAIEQLAVRDTRRSKLDPHRDYILGLVETTPDMTISEMLDKLAAERDVYAARATLWIFLDRCGLTFKKRPRTRPSRTARTS